MEEEVFLYVKSGLIVSRNFIPICIPSMSNTHGKCNTPFYSVWRSMKKRCTNTNAPYYKNYGGRGISVCKEWSDSFDKFYDFMKRNFQSKMTYCECMEKYFPKTKVENSLTLENEMNDFLSNLSEEKKEKLRNDLTKIVTEISKKTKLYL